MGARKYWGRPQGQSYELVVRSLSRLTLPVSSPISSPPAYADVISRFKFQEFRSGLWCWFKPSCMNKHLFTIWPRSDMDWALSRSDLGHTYGDGRLPWKMTEYQMLSYLWSNRGNILLFPEGLIGGVRRSYISPPDFWRQAQTPYAEFPPAERRQYYVIARPDG